MYILQNQSSWSAISRCKPAECKPTRSVIYAFIFFKELQKALGFTTDSVLPYHGFESQPFREGVNTVIFIYPIVHVFVKLGICFFL